VWWGNLIVFIAVMEEFRMALDWRLKKKELHTVSAMPEQITKPVPVTATERKPLNPPEKPVQIPVQYFTCRACKTTVVWLSIHGAYTCERCHPPASEKLVVSRCEGIPC
jgi:hypothetical protein